MPPTERERQVLRDIESGLRHMDRFLAARFALLPIRAAAHRRLVRVLLAVEMTLLILVAVGVLAGSEALLDPVVALAVAEPLVAIAVVSGGWNDSRNGPPKEA